ncbi:MAG: DUF1826 domain-containing protein, partial [Pseudomonadota bacterium]
MNEHARIPGDARAGFLEGAVAEACSAEDLTRLCRSDFGAVIWRRAIPDAVLGWLAALDPGQLPAGRMILRPDAVESAVQACCDIAGMPDGDERRVLVRDIGLLGATFSDMMRAPYLRLRLDVVQSNACRKFHVDTVSARLICTYRGTGTQFGVSAGGADPEAVSSVPTGLPIVLRGRLWPTAQEVDLLHRSPPIEGTGETRMLLVLDPVTDP